MSETELNYKLNAKQIRGKTNKGKPVVVMSNLDSEHDITTMVHQLLSKDDFSVTSSIFVAIPSSDDYDSDLSMDSSCISIQLSEHYHYRNKNTLS